jgi:hypothetical protein
VNILHYDIGQMLAKHSCDRVDCLQPFLVLCLCFTWKRRRGVPDTGTGIGTGRFLEQPATTGTGGFWLAGTGCKFFPGTLQSSHFLQYNAAVSLMVHSCQSAAVACTLYCRVHRSIIKAWHAASQPHFPVRPSATCYFCLRV